MSYKQRLETIYNGAFGQPKNDPAPKNEANLRRVKRMGSYFVFIISKKNFEEYHDKFREIAKSYEGFHAIHTTKRVGMEFVFTKEMDALKCLKKFRELHLTGDVEDDDDADESVMGAYDCEDPNSPNKIEEDK